MKMDVDTVVKLVLAMLTGLFGTSTGILAWSLKVIRENMVRDTAAASRKAEDAKTVTDEIRLNYIDRFDMLKDTINTHNTTVLNRISQLENKLAERYIQKSDCPFIHNNKP